ncbi:MAG TPA: holo-ACP synthase, partial [Phycisphaerae bacterium]|nr:holo-ACP synthase [Phycisphaerae bacterium]
EHLAGRFAAKEAVLKVLGTGWRNGINWTDIEIRNEPSGQPRVRLSGRCLEIADEMALTKVLVSISHISTHAVATAIGLTAAHGGALGIGD